MVDELLSPKFSPDDSFGIIHEKYNAMRHWCDVQKTGHDAYYQDIERYGTEKVACPKCDSSLIFYRSDKPHIDECGLRA